MSFDLYLAPDGFRDWKDSQWQAFFESEPESIDLGNNRYVASAIDVITHNIERGLAGSRFPLLMRIDNDEVPGWYSSELEQLSAEVDELRTALAAVPVNESTLLCDPEEFHCRMAAYQRPGQQSPPGNLLEVYEHLLNGFVEMIPKARTAEMGIFVSY